MSDLTVNYSKFQPDAVSEEGLQTLEIIKSMPRDEPWWEVSLGASHSFSLTNTFGSEWTSTTGESKLESFYTNPDA